MIDIISLVIIVKIISICKLMNMNYLKISLGIFVALAASRFIPHPPNFTSLLALSFYVPAILGIRYLPVLLISFVLTLLFLY